jgi:hypothetical protein
VVVVAWEALEPTQEPAVPVDQAAVAPEEIHLGVVPLVAQALLEQ